MDSSNRESRGGLHDRSDSEHDYHEADHERHGPVSRDKSSGDVLSRQSSKDTDRDVDEWEVREREKPAFDRQRVCLVYC